MISKPQRLPKLSRHPGTGQAYVTFSRQVKRRLGSIGVSLFPYRDRAFLRSKKAKVAIWWQVGSCVSWSAAARRD